MVRHHRLFLFVQAIAISGGIVLACTGTDPTATPTSTTDGGAPGADGSTVVEDAMAAVDASRSTADVDGGFSLANGGFEVQGCTGWTPKSSIPTTSTEAHEGKYACLVCQSGDVGVYSIAQRFPVATALLSGRTYTLTAWLRAPSTGIAATAVHLGINVDNNGADPGVYSETPVPALIDSYVVRTKGFVNEFDAGEYPSLEIEILNRTGDNGCFLVDAVSFVLEP